MTRDMSQKEFDEACKRRGFVPKRFLGYYQLPSGVQVSVLNAGSRRRDWLAHLIREEERRAKQLEEEGATS